MSKTKTLHRFLSLALCVCLCLTLLPITAQAVTISGNTVTIAGSDAVADIRTAIQTALDTNDTVIVEGSNTIADAFLTLNIPAGKTVEWKADYSGSSAFSLIRLNGGGTFDLQAGTITQLGTSGSAIDSFSADVKLIISGGTVTNNAANNNALIYMSTAPSPASTVNVTVSGGTVHALGNTSMAIYTRGSVLVTDGLIISNNNVAIYIDSSDGSVTVSGGAVFAKNGTLVSTTPAVIRLPNTANYTGPGDNGVVIGWSGSGSSYDEYTNTNLTKAPAGAQVYWDKNGGSENGIYYKKGSAEGFIPVLGVTVTAESEFTLLSPSAAYNAATNTLVISSASFSSSSHTADLTKVKLGGTVITAADTGIFATGTWTVVITNHAAIEALAGFSANGTATGGLVLDAGAFTQISNSLPSKAVASINVTVSGYPAATVGNVTITGTSGTALSAGQTATITLVNDTVIAGGLTAEDATGWITNMPAGVTATASGTGTTITITFGGIPTVAFSAAFNITIPGSALASTVNLTVTPNANAKFGIIAPTATVGDVIINGTSGTALSAGQTATITLVNNTVIAGGLTAADATGWITNMPAGVTATASGTGTTITITFVGTPTVASSAAFNITIPSSALASTVNLTVTANANAKFSIVAPGSTYYLDANGETQTPGAYTYITNSTSFATLNSGWYLLSGSFSRSGKVTVTGDVHLILENGCNVTVTASANDAGIHVPNGNSLTIYAQSTGGDMGKLTTTGSSGGAGIGGGENGAGGVITINGGAVNASGGSGGAGIGGGESGVGGVITINGGAVNASGNSGGAGIGGGSERSGGDITINGGVVIATGGGDNSNTRSGGAGIGGGGALGLNSPGNGGNIIIRGGRVTATGGPCGQAGGGSAGIGGAGAYGNNVAGGAGGNITILGGATVTATGSREATGGGGAGIGGGGGGNNGAGGNAGRIIIEGTVIYSGSAAPGAVRANASTSTRPGAGVGSGGSTSAGNTPTPPADYTAKRYGLIFNAADGQFWLDVDNYDTVGTGDILYASWSGNQWSASANALNLDGFSWETTNARPGVIIVGGTVSMDVNGEVTISSTSGTGLQSGDNITITNGGGYGRLTVQGNTQALAATAFTPPGAYTYWTSDTLPYTPADAGTTVPGGTALTPTASMKFIRVQFGTPPTTYTATVNITVDGTASNTPTVALANDAAGTGSANMTSGSGGVYTAADIPDGTTKYIFVNDKYTGLTLSDATAKAVPMFTVNFTAAAVNGTGSGGTVSAKYATDNAVTQVQGDTIANGGLVVSGSKVTFSITKTVPTDTVTWSGGASGTADTVDVTYDAVKTNVVCTTAVAAPTSYAIGFTTNGVQDNGVTATGTISPASPQAATTEITVTITLSGTATAAGTHTVGLTSNTLGGGITAPIPVTKAVTASDTPTDTFAFTFTMPSGAVNDLVVTHSFSAAVDAVTPNITGQPSGATYTVGATATALSVTANVTDGGTLSYQWFSNTADSTIGGTSVGTNATYQPSTTAAGTIYYYVVVTNTNNSATGNKTATATSSTAAVVINAAPTPPVISTAPGALTGGTVGVPYIVTLSATNSPTNWTVSTGSLPGGLALGNNGVISGTPNAAGTFSFSVTATNSDGNSSPVAFNIIIAKGTQNAPTGLGKTDESIASAGDGTITGVTTDMEYKLSTAPSYTTCGSTTIAGLTAGTYLVRYTETIDYNASGDTPVVIGTVGAALSFADSATYDIPASTVGTAIAPIDVSGGAAGGTTPYTFSAAGLPAGITISAAGVISGTPTTAGTSGTATITVTDGSSATEDITINYGAISANPTTYTVTVNGGSGGGNYAQGATVTITANAAPSGQVFDKWTTTSAGVTFASATSTTTTFSMPTNAVTVTATYKSAGGNNNGGGGGGGSITPTTPETGDNKLATPKGQDPVVDSNGNTTLPGGGTVETPGGSTIDLPAGTTIDKDGNVTVPSGKEAEITLPGGQEITLPGGSTVDGKGNITTGGDTQVNLPGDKTIDAPEGSTITGDGKLTVGAGGATFTGGGITLHIAAGTEIILDEDVPLGYLPLFGNPFADVKSSDWFYYNVGFAYTHGLFSGTSATTFSPGASMTRGMFATVLSRLDGANLGGYTTSRFDDVPLGEWYTAPIEWAAEMGIVSGTGDSTFSPNSPITREQMAVMLYNYMKYKGITIPAGTAAAFADDDSISDWAQEAVGAIRAMGIVSGKPGNLFDPQGVATRAEVATIFARFVELIIAD